ncbi:MAG: hypothetical protein EOO50_02820 [Flavobacterium sp.]|uniref:GldM family protein n=1 Tax=Flavobacterium sp. TaxID=239 RepID=UPI0012141792|nr:GldM family protein [Flavobacterium sp.]RZJ68036.1 MAG: hypothetical protein EOO50_02820 [Flavobacterium sp.]
MKYLAPSLSLFLVAFALFWKSVDADVKQPFSLVSVDMLEKYVYRGMPNLLTIQVPNAKSVKVTGDGLTKVDDFGHYKFSPGSGTEAKLNVEAIMQNGSKFKDVITLRIGNIPGRRNFFSGFDSYCDIPKLTVEQFDRGKLSATRDFRYEETITVKEFKVRIPGKSIMTVASDSLPENLISDVKKLKKGSQLMFYDIKVKSSLFPTMGCDKNAPILLEVR